MTRRTLHTEAAGRRAIAVAVISIAGVFTAVALTAPAGAATKTTKAAKAKPAAKGPTTFPALKVLDLATAKTVDLATLNVSKKPQLIWFWAPT